MLVNPKNGALNLAEIQHHFFRGIGEGIRIGFINLEHHSHTPIKSFASFFTRKGPAYSISFGMLFFGSVIYLRIALLNTSCAGVSIAQLSGAVIVTEILAVGGAVNIVFIRTSDCLPCDFRLAV